MTIGIYKLDFANTDKVYIVQSINIEVRYKQHINLLRLNKSSIKLQEAYSLYGNPLLDILVECTKEEIYECEKESIEIFNSISNGFNTCTCAGGISSLYGEQHGRSNYIN